MSVSITERVVAFVREHYLRHGAGCDVKTIAAGVSVSGTTVRRALRDEHGFLAEGIAAAKTTVTTHSRNYRMMEHGSTTVQLYYPTREHLRKLILRMRDEHGEEVEL